MTNKEKKTRVLAVSSGGGHWIQLLRLRPAFAGTDVVFASVGESRAADVAPALYRSIPDANRAQKIKLLWLLVRLFWLVVRQRPDVVISTDAEELSLSANLAKRHCDLVLTQWPHLADHDRPGYRGSVI